MVSNLRPQDSQNSGDNVFSGLPVGKDEEALAGRFLVEHDFSAHTRRAIRLDLRKFAKWFAQANQEAFTLKRVTVRDVSGFRDCMRQDHGQAVATVNRCLVTLRRFFNWLVETQFLDANPAKSVKELRRQELAPKGLDRSQVRRLLRETELREDLRSAAIFSLMLYTGCRVGDVVGLSLHDLLMTERSGTVVFRHGKGQKQRSVPLPLQARRAIEAYLETRPPIASPRVFVGERGALGDRAIRAICDQYSAIIGMRIHPHLLRHTFSHQYLDANPGDLVGLAQILGHENLNTTARYSKHSSEILAKATERLGY